MIEVIQPGLFTTIQDLGRFGYRKYGVPASGAMDQNSAKLANQIIGNNENMPVLEVTLIGPTLKFNEACEIAITGAEFEPLLNGSMISNHAIVHIQKGDILKFGHVKKGMRAYVATAGGFDSEIVMGSASYYQNLTSHSQIKKEENLFFIKNLNSNNVNSAINSISATALNQSQINVYKGPEFDRLSKEMQVNLLNSEFKVSNHSNRMGIRLLNNEPNLSANEIITSPVQPGTVQLTPSGQLIILGRDAQTTGGYARVLQLTEQAQDCLAQINIGNCIEFNLVRYL